MIEERVHKKRLAAGGRSVQPSGSRTLCRIARIFWLDASSGDSTIAVAGRAKRPSACTSSSARRVLVALYIGSFYRAWVREYADGSFGGSG
jgi:hypothetical protein